eukprot:scaffold13613_cov112-Isochrysis_galbana.AAC.3
MGPATASGGGESMSLVQAEALSPAVRRKMWTVRPLRSARRPASLRRCSLWSGWWRSGAARRKRCLPSGTRTGRCGHGKGGDFAQGAASELWAATLARCWLVDDDAPPGGTAEGARTA